MTIPLTHLQECPRPTGAFPDLFYEMREIMNFTVNVVSPPDKKWGGPLVKD